MAVRSNAESTSGECLLIKLMVLFKIYIAYHAILYKNIKFTTLSVLDAYLYQYMGSIKSYQCPGCVPVPVHGLIVCPGCVLYIVCPGCLPVPVHGLIVCPGCVPVPVPVPEFDLCPRHLLQFLPRNVSWPVRSENRLLWLEICLLFLLLYVIKICI